VKRVTSSRHPRACDRTGCRDRPRRRRAFWARHPFVGIAADRTMRQRPTRRRALPREQSPRAESGPSRGRHPRRRRTNFAIHEKMPRSRDGCGAALLATAVLRCVPRHFGHGERWSRGSLIHSAGKTVPQLPHAIPADMLADPLPLRGVGLFGVVNQSRGPFVVKNVIAAWNAEEVARSKYNGGHRIRTCKRLSARRFSRPLH
jgi:hypothetical protein